jgi:hypothetical protein
VRFNPDREAEVSGGNKEKIECERPGNLRMESDGPICISCADDYEMEIVERRMDYLVLTMTWRTFAHFS